MTPDRRQRVAELFEAALDRDAESAAQWIAREAADDPAVRDEALSLLASHSRANCFATILISPRSIAGCRTCI